MDGLGFYKITLPFESNLFNDLSNSIEFESTAKGRIGNHLLKEDDKGIPIVRTTSKYTIPAQNFCSIHDMIAKSINDTILENSLDKIPMQNFNNALIEVYDSIYSKMNYHSDQSLDLEDDSFIGVFSCYEQPDKLLEQNLRKLKIKNKVSNEEFEIVLTHNSVILFSLATNTNFLHKIVLDLPPNLKQPTPNNKWLGITFRKSKTYVKVNDNLCYFCSGELLKLANEEQEKEFYQLRGQENRTVNFVYPNLTYTLSIADMMKPKNI
jgi:hypothetical protein